MLYCTELSVHRFVPKSEWTWNMGVEKSEYFESRAQPTVASFGIFDMARHCCKMYAYVHAPKFARHGRGVSCHVTNIKNEYEIQSILP